MLGKYHSKNYWIFQLMHLIENRILLYILGHNKCLLSNFSKLKAVYNIVTGGGGGESSTRIANDHGTPTTNRIRQLVFDSWK